MLLGRIFPASGNEFIGAWDVWIARKAALSSNGKIACSVIETTSDKLSPSA